MFSYTTAYSAYDHCFVSIKVLSTLKCTKITECVGTMPVKVKGTATAVASPDMNCDPWGSFKRKVCCSS